MGGCALPVNGRVQEAGGGACPTARPLRSRRHHRDAAARTIQGLDASRYASSTTGGCTATPSPWPGRWPTDSPRWVGGWGDPGPIRGGPHGALEQADLVVLGDRPRLGITRPASRKRPDAVGYRIGPGRLGASPQAGENLGAAFDTDSPRRGGWTVVPRWAGLGGSGEQPPLGMELMEMVDTSGLQPGRRPRDRAAAGQDGQATPGDPGPR
jgi:hypothetical protein